MYTFQQICLSQTRCYLLKANDGYLLIDCGSAGDARTLLAKLAGKGLSLLSIRYLLLTHHHSDHCGLLPFLLSENPGICVIMSEKCAAYLEAGCHFHPAGERYAVKALGRLMWLYGQLDGKLASEFRPYLKRTCDVIWPGQDGDLPEAAVIGGKLINTPGHTEDSVSLVIGEHAFVGDAARNMLNFLGAPYEPVLYNNRRACYESWAKLISMGVKYIHPAHGRSFPIKYLMDQYRRYEN